MTDQEQLLHFSLFGIIFFIFVLPVIFRRNQTVGLTPSFLLIFLVNYWLGPVLDAISSKMFLPTDVVLAGLQQSVVGLGTFAFTTIFFTPFVTRRWLIPPRDAAVDEQVKPELPWRICIYAVVGAVFFLLNPFLQPSPVFGVISREFGKFLILAACLLIYFKSRTGSHFTFLYALALGAVLTIAGVVYSGFASGGAVISAFLLMFFLVYTRINVKTLVLVVLIGYVGISAFTTYFGNRDNIRSVVWSDSDLESRLNVLSDTAAQFEFFSPANSDQMLYIDVRLNRTFFVGLAVQRIEAGFVDYSFGQTLANAIIAPIPRALWPEKPVISGTSDLFTQYTGIHLNPTTTPGVGLLLESYINFGPIGVVLFFCVYAILLGEFDAVARQALDLGDYASAGIWLLTGFELVNPLDNLAGVIAAMISTFVFFKLLYYVVLPMVRQDNRIPVPSSLPPNTAPAGTLTESDSLRPLGEL